MKRKDLIKELESNGCFLVRHGSNHDLYQNPQTGKKAPIPRHTEVNDYLVKKIKKELGIPGNTK